MNIIWRVHSIYSRQVEMKFKGLFILTLIVFGLLVDISQAVNQENQNPDETIVNVISHLAHENPYLLVGGTVVSVVAISAIGIGMLSAGIYLACGTINAAGVSGAMGAAGVGGAMKVAAVGGAVVTGVASLANSRPVQEV